MDEEALIKDIRDGLSDSELMERHGLSTAELRKRLLRLMRDNVVDSPALYWRPILYDYDVGDDDRRGVPRYPLKLLLPVSTVGSPEGASGLIVDISEKGGCVRGMSPTLGEKVALRIDPRMICSTGEITLEVIFRWCERTGGDDFLAGFEIVSVSGKDAELLRDLIRRVVRR